MTTIWVDTEIKENSEKTLTVTREFWGTSAEVCVCVYVCEEAYQFIQYKHKLDVYHEDYQFGHFNV
jgi:hypothetical protein